MQPQLHCNSGGFGLCDDILLRRPEEAAESLNSGRWWPGRWGSGWGSGGGGEGGEVTRSREAFFKKKTLKMVGAVIVCGQRGRQRL